MNQDLRSGIEALEDSVKRKALLGLYPHQCKAILNALQEKETAKSEEVTGDELDYFIWSKIGGIVDVTRVCMVLKEALPKKFKITRRNMEA